MKYRFPHQSLFLVTLALGLILPLPAQSALIDRGGGLIYDDVLNITWLQDANYAATQYAQSGGTLGDADGKMTWDDANAWAFGLSYYDSVRNVVYNDWRLSPVALTVDYNNPGPTSSPSGPDSGWNVLTYDSSAGTVYSELAYMYYDNLGLKATSTQMVHTLLTRVFLEMLLGTASMNLHSDKTMSD